MTVVVDTNVLAEFIVTKDRDLLARGKPFGVEVVTPRDFYRKFEA